MEVTEMKERTAGAAPAMETTPTLVSRLRGSETSSWENLRRGNTEYDYKRRPYKGGPLLRFLSKVNTNGGISEYAPQLGQCWLWTAEIDHRGYGQFWYEGKVQLAYVVGYRDIAGFEIPDGLELDHLCRVRACVRFDHLEPVTHQENVRRSPLMWKGGISLIRTPRVALTSEERKRRNKESHRRYYEANKERLRDYQREYKRKRSAAKKEASS